MFLFLSDIKELELTDLTPSDNSLIPVSPSSPQTMKPILDLVPAPRLIPV